MARMIINKDVLAGILALTLVASRAVQAQFAGGMAGSAGASADRSDRVRPRQIELNKRVQTAAESGDDGTSSFIDASAMMNVKADEYVAVFGLLTDAPTIAEANTKFEATLNAFKKSLRELGVKDDDLFVDFVIQNRVYEYKIEDKVIREELAGFELKKNVSIHFRDKDMVDRLSLAAAQVGIYDLIKVDYIVKDVESIHNRLRGEVARLLKQKIERQNKLLGIDNLKPTQVMVDEVGSYYPIDQYQSYSAQESERLGYVTEGRIVIHARKVRTIYFDPIDVDLFDTVINPVIIEPVVQFTAYTRVRCESGRKSTKITSRQNF